MGGGECCILLICFFIFLQRVILNIIALLCDYNMNYIYTVGPILQYSVFMVFQYAFQSSNCYLNLDKYSPLLSSLSKLYLLVTETGVKFDVFVNASLHKRPRERSSQLGTQVFGRALFWTNCLFRDTSTSRPATPTAWWVDLCPCPGSFGCAVFSITSQQLSIWRGRQP